MDGAPAAWSLPGDETDVVVRVPIPGKHLTDQSTMSEDLDGRGVVRSRNDSSTDAAGRPASDGNPCSIMVAAA